MPGIKSDYVEEPDIPKVTQGALQGLVEYLDPVSSYLAPEQFAEYQERLEAVDGGSGLATGMIVRKQGAYTSVLSVLPGSPADEAGIGANDLLDAIDNVSTRVMPPAYLLARLSGQPGSSLTVMVRPSSDYDSPVEHTLVRAAPVLPEIAFRMLEGDIGYVDADLLAPDQVGQIADAIQQLEGEGASRLVLDLRGNASGTPADGIALANLLMDGGRIASAQRAKLLGKGIRSQCGDYDDFPAARGDRRPADIGRCRNRGRPQSSRAIAEKWREKRTSGIAALQKTIVLDDGAALILSVAKYHGPNGESIHNEGVEPDRPVSQRNLRRYREVQRRLFDTPEARKKAEEEVGDPFLEKALEALRDSA